MRVVPGTWLRLAGYGLYLLGATVALFLLLEGVATLAGRLYGACCYRDPEPDAQVFAGKEWAAGYFAEFRRSFTAEYRPYVDYGRPPAIRGRYVNTDGDSRRVTSTCPGSPALTVWFFGGSTMWGTGARDDGTIPSAVVQQICPRIVIHALNFGESGYTSTQALIRLQLELRRGKVPDAVVFYDGANDAFSAWQNGQAGWPQNAANRSADFNAHRRFNVLGGLQNSRIMAVVQELAGTRPVTMPAVTPALLAETVRVYRENQRQVRALAQEYGFAPLFFWQPTLYSRRNTSAAEASIPRQLPFGDLLLGVTAALEPGSVRDLSGAFDDHSEALYFDDIHTGEEGYHIIAGLMARDLEQLAAAKGARAIRTP